MASGHGSGAAMIDLAAPAAVLEIAEIQVFAGPEFERAMATSPSIAGGLAGLMPQKQQSPDPIEVYPGVLARTVARFEKSGLTLAGGQKTTHEKMKELQHVTLALGRARGFDRKLQGGNAEIMVEMPEGERRYMEHIGKRPSQVGPMVPLSVVTCDEHEQMYVEGTPPEAQAVRLANVEPDNVIAPVGTMTPGAQMPRPRIKRTNDDTMVIKIRDDSTESGASWLALKLRVDEEASKLERRVQAQEGKNERRPRDAMNRIFSREQTDEFRDESGKN